MRRVIAVAIWLLLAAGTFYLFMTRYWLHRECIEAAISSCITPEGDSLIPGGMFWAAPTMVFLVLAVVSALRR